MPDARVLFGAAQLGNRHAAVAANAPEIVAHEINDHHVLRPVLGRTEEAATARLGAAVALRRALDWRAEDMTTPAPQEELRREARHGERGMAEIGTETRLENTCTGAEQLERLSREIRLETCADIHLVDVTRADVLDGPRHRPHVRLGLRAHQKRAAFELAPLPHARRAAPLPGIEARLEPL